MANIEGKRYDPVDKFGIPQSVYEQEQRLSMLPEEAYELVVAMSSHLLAEDLAQAYVQSRPQRVYVAKTFRQLGIRGEELGFVMKTLQELAIGNAQPRRR